MRASESQVPTQAIDFYDEQGLRWTVTTPDVPGVEGPSHATLVFTSESGECRRSETWLPEGATWEGVEERTWCAFLRYSDIAAVNSQEPLTRI